MLEECWKLEVKISDRLLSDMDKLEMGLMRMKLGLMRMKFLRPHIRQILDRTQPLCVEPKDLQDLNEMYHLIKG